MDNNVVIIDAKRTAIGNFCGSLSSLTAVDLGSHVISSLINTNNLGAHEIDEVILGQVLTSGCGQNPARQAMIKSQIPVHIPAFTINKVCGSGLKSIILGYQSIVLGNSDIVIAGGQESMSLAPHMINLRFPTKHGNASLVDSVIKDGLWDCFNDYHMGTTAENVALKLNITREEQDSFALNSQKKVAEAQKAKRFTEEIVPIEIKNKKSTILVDTDEFPKNDTSMEALAALRPAFSREGTVTAGNASGINDGAAAVILMSERLAKKKNLTPMAYIKSYASAGIDPSIMGLGPVAAIPKAVAMAKMSIHDMDLIELNEAFAAQSIGVIKELGLNENVINVNGGAIALGHPIGASGARCLVTLLQEMKKRQVKNGLVALCIGGGMGIAMCVSNNP